jgi:putative glycosyltransferase (TIGR04372 family)
MKIISTKVNRKTIGGLIRRFKSRGGVFFLPLLLILVLFIRIISPFYRIRLKETCSTRLGHFSSEIDYYLASRLIEGKPLKTFDIFGYDAHKICNQQLARMWARKMFFVPFIRHISRINRMLPGWKRHEVPWYDSFQQKRIIMPKHSFLEFTKEEFDHGRKILSEILGSKTGPIVCVFNRDSKYLKVEHPDRNWDYHNYRDSSIYNYLPAMEWLVKQGYIVMRMGAIVSEPVGRVSDKIIDYATKYRSDFMDVFLFGICDFTLGSTTGQASLGSAFRKSVGFVNVTPFLSIKHIATTKYDLFIPKLYFSESKNRLLSIEEIVVNNLDFMSTSEDFQIHRIRLIECDCKDILNEAKEIEALVSGKLIFSKEDIDLQRKFWKAAKIDYDEAIYYPQPSPAFLKRHKESLFN